MRFSPKHNFHIVLFVGILLLLGCKTDKKAKPYKSSLSLTKNLSDFTTHMTEKDTIKILANIGAEWWIRKDELIITKSENQIRLQTTIKEDTTFMLKYQMRTNKLPIIILENKTNNFENFFFKKIKRTEVKDLDFIYKVMGPVDTLVFYTSGLGDKGGELKKYLEFMRSYYPGEKEFIPIEEIDENEME